MSDVYRVRRFQNNDADEVSKLIITHFYVICDKERIEIPASITACEFYKKMGYTYKNGIDVIDEEQLFRLEKFR